MNEAIVSIMTDYLKDKDTDYALMINGAWGSGKTYFINNTLKAEIESVECPKNDNDKKKTYKQIFVSLYGVASIEEINERIFYAINPIFKWVEIASNKIVSALETAAWGGFFKNLVPSNNEEKDKIRSAITNYDDKVFFFDDLERIDKNKIDIQSVLGYINSLTEHKHYKVIVVANDEVLGDDYKLFKEKTIRFSYHHCPKMSDIFDSVCKKYEESNQYKKFLDEQKTFILDIISAGRCKNIRTLIFVTDVYKKIFERTQGEYDSEINQDLLLPFTLISIEAKNGHAKEELKDALQSIGSLSIMDFLPNHEQYENKQCTPKEEYEQELNIKYIRFKSDRLIRFYDELFELIYDGYVSPNNLDTVITNLRNEYKAKIETDEIKLVKQIINYNWTQIPDDEFPIIVEKVKKNVVENKYRVSDLLKIYAAFVQIEAMNIEGFTLSEDETKTFKEAIGVSMKDLSYQSFLHIQLPMWNENDMSKAKYNELRNYALEINEEHKKETDSRKKQDILDMIKNNDNEKFRSFFADFNNRSLFVEIPSKDMITAISSANAEIKQVLGLGLSTFFPENLTNPSKNSLGYLEDINAKLNDYLNKQTERKPSLVNLYRIQNYLNVVISNYKRRLNIQ